MASNSFKVKNSLVLTPKDLATLTSPEAGDLACDINDSNKIKRYDAASASWVEVGSGGGVGGVDIFFVQDFESASLSSFTQTGLVLSQTDPLKGKVSAVLTHQAGVSPTNDQSFKQVIPVDRKFRGQTMVLRLDAKSSASAGNLVIKITNETASTDLVASEQLEISNDVNGAKSSVSFTIPESCASLSYTITALPQSGSPVSRIDDIICELASTALLETAVEVPVVTGWQGYTPTFQGFGSPTNVEFEWRQVGENVEIRGKFASGTSTAVEARVGLPAGLTSASTSLIPSLQIIGYAARGTSLSASFTVIAEPNTSYLVIGAQTGTTGGLSKLNGSSVIASGDTLSFFASVPCSGLSATTTKTIPLTQSGLVQEGDSSIKLRNFSSYGTTATKIPRFSVLDLNLGSNILYVDSPTDGASFTIQKSGTYTFNLGFSANIAHAIALSKNPTSGQKTTNASSLAGSEILARASGLAGNTSGYVSWTGELVAGDVIYPHTDGVASSGGNEVRAIISASYQSSLKQVSVNPNSKITIPTSELRMEGASSRGSTATAIVRFDNVAKLRGDAFTVESDSVLGTRITMKKAGRLSVSASLFYGSSAYTRISRNQAIRTSLPVASEILAASGGITSPIGGASWTGDVNIGDIIRVSTDVSPSANAANSLNLSFQEQEIAVSVSNVLPQFSESDSSVRVDTANGYGSTGTKIRRFSNVRDNVGTDIEYVPSGVNGDSFVVKSSGIYNISYSDNFSAGEPAGITKNTSSLSTNLSALPVSEILAVDYASTASGSTNVSWQGYLIAGDIIRPHTNGAASSTAYSGFTISKVGKPNVTGVDVTPFVNVPQPESCIIASPVGMTYTTATGVIKVSSSFTVSNPSIINVDNTGSSTRFRANKRCSLSISWACSSNVTGTATQILKNGTAYAYGTTAGSANQWVIVTANMELFVGEYFELSSGGGQTVSSGSMTVVAEALSDTILTAPETFSTDTAALQYASSAQYTLTTLANAPVGTYITFTYAASSAVITQTTTRPTQTDADMNTNGIRLFGRGAFTSASTAASPSRVAIQIGKGMKGISLDGYSATAKTTSVLTDYFLISTTDQYGVSKNYDEKTGILVLDCGYVTSGRSAWFGLDTNINSTVNNGYLVINASKNPALTGLNVLQPRIATLSDVKASGTAGGTATSGSYQTRTLNTIDDPTGFVASLASNQFTLPAGEYYIEASAVAGAVGNHKIKIRNITDSSDSIIGVAAFNPTSVVNNISAIAVGKITISSSKLFELQHRVTTTTASIGLGSAASYGDNEVYSIVKITKVK